MSARYVAMIVEALVMAVFGALVEWGATHGRPKVDRESGDLIFQYGRSARFIAKSLLIASAVLFGLIVLTIPIRNESDVLATCGLFGILLVPAGILSWEFTRLCIVVSPAGIDFRPAWGRRVFVAWQEIEEVSYRTLLKWFVLRSSHGQTIHVTTLIAGISDFLGELEMNLDPSVLTSARPGFLIMGRSVPGTNEES